MKYGYTVKKNGIIYRAGQEVPDNKPKVEEKVVEEVAVEETTTPKRQYNKKSKSEE